MSEDNDDKILEFLQIFRSKITNQNLVTWLLKRSD